MGGRAITQGLKARGGITPKNTLEHKKKQIARPKQRGSGTENFKQKTKK